VPRWHISSGIRARACSRTRWADEFESYEGIVGVILRGRLHADRFAIDHAAGFSFAGSPFGHGAGSPFGHGAGTLPDGLRE